MQYNGRVDLSCDWPNKTPKRRETFRLCPTCELFHLTTETFIKAPLRTSYFGRFRSVANAATFEIFRLHVDSRLNVRFIAQE